MRVEFAGAVLVLVCASVALAQEGSNGVSCPLGTLIHESPPGNVSCVVCPAGCYCASQSTVVHCAPGQFCPEGATAPLPCPSGSFCPDPAYRLPCPGGTYCGYGLKNPNPCPEGSFCPDPSLSVHCPVGSHCPGGTVMHYPCPSNTYADAPRSARCTPCPEGTVSTGLGAASFANCTLSEATNGTISATAAAGGIAGITGFLYSIIQCLGLSTPMTILPLAGHRPAIRY